MPGPTNKNTFGGKRRLNALGAGPIILGLLLLCHAACGAEISRERELKSVYLFNLAQFTEWPSSAFGNEHSPIIIGVLGADPLGKTLDDVVKGETVQGRPLVVERYRTMAEVKLCHILFIPQSESRNLEKVLLQLKGKPVLTVSDADAAAIRGVMVRLVPEHNKLRLKVNLNTLEQANLKMSSKLLRLAQIVPEESKP